VIKPDFITLSNVGASNIHAIPMISSVIYFHYFLHSLKSPARSRAFQPNGTGFPQPQGNTKSTSPADRDTRMHGVGSSELNEVESCAVLLLCDELNAGYICSHPPSRVAHFSLVSQIFNVFAFQHFIFFAIWIWISFYSSHAGESLE
jgi:hypothetical protein